MAPLECHPERPVDGAESLSTSNCEVGEDGIEADGIRNAAEIVEAMLQSG